MKKLILKTIAFTLSGVIVAMALTYGILALFSPLTLANMFDSVGNKSVSVHYLEKAYNKNNSTENLYLLCLNVDEISDSDRAEKYLTIFVEKSDFSSFCAQKDLTDSQGFMGNEDFFYGKYVLSIFNNNKDNLGLTNAITKCVLRVETAGYKNYNPFCILITAGGLNNQQLDQVDLAIANIYEALSEQEKEYATQDRQTITSMKNN